MNRAQQTIEFVATSLRLLREIPNHVQAAEFRREVETVKRECPELHAAAEIMVNEEYSRQNAKGLNR
jgi:hypothetical protein